ncbi:MULTISPECIES: hypothetical protein [Roseomonadaceae]|uniref:DUF4398 domain-containing protein n=1 Tax=Falsiroseomonas oleicola TaxID=2801474 RepID=A0ABS6HAL0_9PROT|nr:hypothetical protein [Roseomonas oleicola]MBU8544360.1 hypothetical protein [Roseomonas oleicola]
MRIRSTLAFATALAIPLALPGLAHAQVMTQTQGTAAPHSAPGHSITNPSPAAADQAETFLRQARESLSAGRIAQARENLEQAETRILTRSVMPDRASTPASSGAIAEIGAARDALNRRDRAEVNRRIDQAMAALSAPSPAAQSTGAVMNRDAMVPDSMTGAGSATPQTMGGGAPRNLGPAPAPMFTPGPMPAPSTP